MKAWSLIVKSQQRPIYAVILFESLDGAMPGASIGEAISFPGGLDRRAGKPLWSA
jgi:hypothetical protein